MKTPRIWVKAVVVCAVVAVALAASFAWRSYKVARTAMTVEQNVRYLIQNGGTIGEVPASDAFSTEFLTAVFGDDPDLLDQLQAVIGHGLSEDPALNLGEVVAMMVTYHKPEGGKVEDVVVHAVGGFGLGKMKPGFHRDGYFFQQLDPNLWRWGNIFVNFLGRDMVLFSKDEASTKKQQELLDTLFTGDIMTLVQELGRPMYFAAVFPDPRRVVPSEMRGHLRAVVLRGLLSYEKGSWELLILTPSEKSANYTLALTYDMKTAAELALKTQWNGVVQHREWGDVIDPWWAYEMVQTLEKSTLQKEKNIISLKSDFGRVMVNAVLKGVERMSRDLAAMRGTMEKGLDPRVVDAQLRSSKPLHYWSEPHEWGPNWPIPPPGTTDVARYIAPAAEADPAVAKTSPTP